MKDLGTGIEYYFPCNKFVVYNHHDDDARNRKVAQKTLLPCSAEAFSTTEKPAVVDEGRKVGYID